MLVLYGFKMAASNQGCALAEPNSPWCLTFSLVQLENLRFFIQIIMLGTLDFTGSEHWVPF